MDIYNTALACEGQRGIPALLLSEALDVVVARIVDFDAAAIVDGEAALFREISVAQRVLRSCRRRIAKLSGPPSSGLIRRLGHEQAHAFTGFSASSLTL